MDTLFSRYRDPSTGPHYSDSSVELLARFRTGKERKGHRKSKDQRKSKDRELLEGDRSSISGQKSSELSFHQRVLREVKRFIEDYKAEPMEMSLWEFYKNYKKERELFKMWMQSRIHKDQKSQISGPYPLVPDWSGADSNADYPDDRPDPTQIDGRGIGFGGNFQSTSPYAPCGGEEFGMRDTIPTRTGLNPTTREPFNSPGEPSLPAQRKGASASTLSASSVYSRDIYGFCYEPTHTNFNRGVCSDCSGMLPRPPLPRGRSSNADSMWFDEEMLWEEASRMLGADREPCKHHGQEPRYGVTEPSPKEDVPIVYSPEPESGRLPQTKIHGSSKYRIHRRPKARHSDGTRAGSHQASTTIGSGTRTRNNFEFELDDDDADEFDLDDDEVKPAQYLLEGQPF
ncbi:hypothetical protein FGG08_003345 [Glutinoglossum americanum]|uniref:Uncharacterized protein n=1 Tax=Glutinoglossum americanum TaxID=1670608 RepID=A0A9P8L3Q3_9PEZI|nr:hypothetical protein FGG08_003345 [Glutinoglossum americanum]